MEIERKTTKEESNVLMSKIEKLLVKATPLGGFDELSNSEKLMLTKMSNKAE